MKRRGRRFYERDETLAALGKQKGDTACGRPACSKLRPVVWTARAGGPRLLFGEFGEDALGFFGYGPFAAWNEPNVTAHV